MSVQSAGSPLSAASVVDAYYKAYQAPDADGVAAALNAILADDIVLDSPLVQAKFGQALRGKQAALAATVAVAPFLKNATVEGRYVNADNANSAAALIHFPTPVGVVFQSEHFDLDPTTKKITRLRSYYDPRKLLPPTG